MEVRLGNLLHIKSRTGDRWSVNQKMLLNKLLRPGMGLLASEVEPLARFVFFLPLARSHTRLPPLARNLRYARTLDARSSLYPRSPSRARLLAARSLLPCRSLVPLCHDIFPLCQLLAILRSFFSLTLGLAFAGAASPRSYPLPTACRPLARSLARHLLPSRSLVPSA